MSDAEWDDEEYSDDGHGHVSMICRCWVSTAAACSEQVRPNTPKSYSNL